MLSSECLGYANTEVCTPQLILLSGIHTQTAMIGDELCMKKMYTLW